MLFRTGNIWDVYKDSDLFVITTNSFIKSNGNLTMGKGIALEARLYIPNLEQILGNLIKKKCGHLGEYGIVQHEKIIALQTKIHFKDGSSLELIKNSVDELKKIIKPEQIINMVYPRIGYGGLSEEDVYWGCGLNTLSDNIVIWRKEKV